MKNVALELTPDLDGMDRLGLENNFRDSLYTNLENSLHFNNLGAYLYDTLKVSLLCSAP